jgi:hypothetical protein
MDSHIDDKSQVPTLNVNVGMPKEAPKSGELIKKEDITGYFAEVFSDMRADRVELDEVIQNFTDMVFNPASGEASAATKETLANLLKTKSDMADKKIKAIDLMLRAYLKEKDTFPKYLAVHQHNEYSEKRRILKNIESEEQSHE